MCGDFSEQRDPLITAFDEALEELGLKVATSDARHAAGRLAALQIASHFGMRLPRRMLSWERERLVQACFKSTRSLE